MAKASGFPSGDVSKAQILERIERDKVRFMRLQFTDILGTIKNVEVADRQFEQALNGQVLFDGSSIEGFVRIEESDMYLRPDLSTYRVFPWTAPTGEGVARIVCDILTPDGEPFVGCPRTSLKRVLAFAADRGLQLRAGPEIELPLPHA
jgi:glutamine synthetase